MITLTLLEVRSVATAAHGMHAALMVLFAGLLQWATGLCEWQMPRLPAFDRFDPALRHERRLQSLVFGLVWVLLGSAGLAGMRHEMSGLPLPGAGRACQSLRAKTERMPR